MKTVLFKLTAITLLALLAVVLYLSSLGQRLREWLEADETTAKDPIAEHEKYQAPHKY